MRHKGKWDKITAEDLEKATPEIQEDDFVVINTGWQKWLKPNQAYEYYNYYPGLLMDAAEWLVEKKVKAIAGTWPVCDHSLSFTPLKKYMPWVYNDYVRENGHEPGEEYSTGFEGCLTLFLKNGISCIQNAGAISTRLRDNAVPWQHGRFAWKRLTVPWSGWSLLWSKTHFDTDTK